VRTRHLQLVTHEHSDTIGKRESVSSPYGPVNPGSTTLVSQRTLRENQLRQLSELLNSLENVVESLNYKSFTVYDTLTTAIQEVRVALSDIATDTDGTDTI
jgi:hypothetical protein